MTMIKNKKDRQSESLIGVLGPVAYREYEEKTEKSRIEMSNFITQNVVDKFERRLVEEMSKLRSDANDKFDSQIKWMITFMMGQTGIILGFIYFIHQH